MLLALLLQLLAQLAQNFQVMPNKPVLRHQPAGDTSQLLLHHWHAQQVSMFSTLLHHNPGFVLLAPLTQLLQLVGHLQLLVAPVLHVQESLSLALI